MSITEKLLAKKRDTKERANAIFANIIASEGLSIRRSSKVNTASFAPFSRALVLPIFKTGTPSFVEEGMIIHEVGHALWTTPKGFKTFNEDYLTKGVPFGFYNIFEDVRINKLMARKYKGVKAIHNVYYEYLFEEGFFGSENVIQKANFVNQVNVFFKAGKISGLDLTKFPEWKLFGTDIANLETENDAHVLSLKLFEYYKEEERKKEEEKEKEKETKNEEKEDDNSNDTADDSNNDDNDDSSDSDAEEGKEDDNSAESADENSKEEDDNAEENDELNGTDEKEEADDDSNDGSDDASGTGEDETDETAEDDTSSGNDESTEGATGSNETDVAEDDDTAEEDGETTSSGNEGTDKSLEQNLEASDENFEQNLKSLVAPIDYNDIQTVNTFVLQKDTENAITDFGKVINDEYPRYNPYTAHDMMNDDYNPFLAEIKPVVNKMVNEFESKKSAMDFARTSTSDSGSLNVEALHLYKINDDIFLKNEYTPDGKSHGIVMAIDGSYSMVGTRYKKVVRQAIIMCLFAKRVNIPFTLFQFSTGANNDIYDGGMPNEEELYVNLQKTLVMKVATNELKMPALIKRLSHLFEMVDAVGAHHERHQRSNYCKYPKNGHKTKRGIQVYNAMSKKMPFSGTPTESAILVISDYIKVFNKANNIQMTTFVLLTDGDSGGATVKGGNRYWNKDSETMRLRVESSNKTYSVDVSASYRAPKFQESALKILKNETGSNVIAITIDHEVTPQERDAITTKGMTVRKNYQATDITIKYASARFQGGDINSECEITRKLGKDSNRKKVDIMFAQIVAESVARHY